jgi:hypothetical protein
MQSGKRASDETPRLKTFWRNEPNAARCGDRRSNYAAHKMLHDSMHQLELSRPGLAFGVAAHECRLPHTRLQPSVDGCDSARTATPMWPPDDGYLLSSQERLRGTAFARAQRRGRRP